MRIHSFALVVMLLVLSSGSFAVSLDSKAIEGTEFTLLSNTDQCLAECEAWIEWDLSQGILTDVQLPSKASADFSFEVVKEKETTKELEDFGIEVWEEIKGKWEKVSNDFYGFKALKGKVYRLRVWGNKKAGLEQDGIDWIPTFFGQEISEWAWWNSDWWYKQKIVLNTKALSLTGDITKDTVIFVDINSTQTSFWDGINSDGSDIRFVSGDELTEYDFHFEGFDYAGQDLNAWVEVTQDFTAAEDTNIYVYYGNSGAVDVQNEAGTYPDNYTAVYHMNDNNTGGQANSVEDGNVLVHTNTPTVNTNGIMGTAVQYVGADDEYSSASQELMFTQTKAFTISLWHVSDTGGGGEANKTLFSKYQNADDDRLKAEWNAASEINIFVERNGGGNGQFQSINTTWTAGKWYHIVATVDTVGNLLRLYVNGTWGEGGSVAIPGAGVFAEGSTSPLRINANNLGAENGTQHIDEIKVFYGTALTSDDVNLMYASESKGLIEFEAVEAMEGDIDLNISTINGEDFKIHPVFAYGLDGNVSIGWKVFQINNKRLTIDLNYSTHNTQGTGTNIVNDLNLTSDICPDQDWDDEPSECSISWNYSSVTDGNYMINGIITEGIITDFNSSDGNFQIANDVNIVVLPPINENTGETIPSLIVDSTIGYSVKITTADTIKFYDDMIDLNSFMVPLQNTPILVKVDVNVADEYYSRQYSVSFSEAMATYTIQPYLAPVAESGNFIFYVTNLTTTGPLSDVTIIIDGIVPGADGVVIQEIVTDAAGTATIPMLLDTEYSATFYYEGILVHEATIVPTAGSLTYRIGLDISASVSKPEPIGALIIDWFPTTMFLIQNTNGGVDINLSISLQNKTIGSIHTRVLDTNGCLYDQNFYGPTWVDGNTIYYYSVDLNTGASTSITTGLPCIYDNDLSLYGLYVIVDVNSADGNMYSARSINWQILTATNYQWNVWYRLGSTGDSLNAEGSKATTSLIAFFIVFIVIMVLSKTIGNAFFSAIVGLIILGMFVLWGWFDFFVFAFIAFATVFYAMYLWGKTG